MIWQNGFANKRLRLTRLYDLQWHCNNKEPPQKHTNMFDIITAIQLKTLKMNNSCSETQHRWHTEMRNENFKQVLQIIFQMHVPEPVKKLVTSTKTDQLGLCIAIFCCNSSFLAPTTLSTIFPSFRNMKVGIASIAQSVATDCNNVIQLIIQVVNDRNMDEEPQILVKQQIHIQHII